MVEAYYIIIYGWIGLNVWNGSVCVFDCYDLPLVAMTMLDYLKIMGCKKKYRHPMDDSDQLWF